MLLRLLFSILSYLILPVQSGFTFVYPIDESSDEHGALPIFEFNAPTKIRWVTDWVNYTVWSQVLNPNDLTGTPLGASLIYTKTQDKPENGGFLWNITSSSLPGAFSNSTFNLECDDPLSDPFSVSVPFNVTDKKLAQTTSAAIPTTTAIAQGQLNPTITSSTSFAPNSSTTSLFTSVSNSTNAKSSSSKEGLYVGIGVGLGVFLIILISCGFLIITCRRKRHQQPRNELESKSLMLPNQSPQVDVQGEHIPFRNELPTGFNSARSMKPTFLSKFELPGKDHEIVSPDGPFELSSG